MIVRKKTLKPIILILIISIFNLGLYAQSPNYIGLLKGGTAIHLVIMDNIDPTISNIGDQIEFRVINDIIVNGEVVVQSGKQIFGTIEKSVTAKGWGKPGYLEIKVRNIKSVYGTDIPLMNQNIVKKGESEESASLILGIFICFLFFTKKGENPKYNIGDKVKVYTEQDIYF
ncbi:MAG: hypothetical protein ACEPOW_11560 [Bacteroidales bacterium]